MVVKLSERGIKDAVYRLKYLSDNIRVANEQIVEHLVSSGQSKASELNAMAPRSGVETPVVMGKVTESGMKGYVALVGDSAVYDEFGTGEEGAGSPHPMKGNFSLNPYNSGPHIFYNQLANRYQWRYYPMAGKPYFTEDGLTSGIPAGKQMYNTAKYIREIKDQIIKKELNGSIKRINK